MDSDQPGDSTVTRLAEPDLKQHREWLSQWHNPDELARYVSDVNDAMGSTNFFVQPGVEFLRDAWLAAQFGQYRSCEFVRLVAPPAQWPDFEAKTGINVEQIECVEALLPGRRRGDEYRETERRVIAGGSRAQNDPIEDWYARADQVLPSLAATVDAKIKRNYAQRAGLLVYLNIGEWGVRQQEVESGIPGAVAPALPHFTKIWVLWKARLYGPYQQR